MCPVADGDRVVAGVFYPSAFHRDDSDFANEIERLRTMDPRVDVVVEEYIETHDLRTARGQQPASELRHLTPELTDAQRDAFSKINVVLTLDLPFDIASIAPNLRWVQGLGAGTAQLQSAGLKDAGIRLTNASGTSAVGMSEFVLARVLQHTKHLRQLDAQQEQQQWKPIYGRLIEGLTVGLIGYGAINQEVAARFRPFGVTILATHRSANPAAPAAGLDAAFRPGDLHTMLGRADIVVAAVPETPETVDMMDDAAFAAMKPGALFCNVGRGTLVVDAALITALESGQVGAALLDVVHLEPLPADDPMWSAPNLYLSPHCSTAAGELYPKLHKLFRENLRRFLADEPLLNEVDLNLGY
jgi:phosphoglycerate dehydrogenase-like enzyme